MSELTDEWNKVYKSDQYKTFKRKVRRRDEYSCTACGTKGNRSNRLCVHHIKPKAKFIDNIFRIDNGKVLCKKCHIQEHKDMHKDGSDFADLPSLSLDELKEFISTLTFKKYNYYRKRYSTRKRQRYNNKRRKK